MGQFLGNLTNQGTALNDPSTGKTSVGSPNQVLDAAGRAIQAKTQESQVANLSGSPDAMTTGSKPLPSIGAPSFMQATQAGALPGSGNVMSPGLNKAGKLITLLTSGLQGAAAGRAKSEETVAATGGRRSGGAGMGFEAGLTAPLQRAGMTEQFAQEQAKTKLLQQQGDMIQTPGGPMPLALAKVFYPAQIKAGTAETVQQQKNTGALAKQGLANTGELAKQQSANVGKMDVEKMKFAIQNGQVARVTDGVDPETNQPAKIAYNRMGQQIGILPGSLPSSAYLPRESNTVVYQQDANGIILALPKSTTRQTQLPGAPAKPSSGGQGGQARIVNGPGGTPIQKSVPQEVSKAFSTYQDSQSRYNIMQKNYENATKSNDQQAMLSLLANHLGMTMGLAKGARINQAIITEAEQSRPWLQGLASKFDKDGYLQGVTLTPTQMDQMIGLAHDRLGEDLRKYQAMKQFYSSAGSNGAPQNANMPPPGAKIRDYTQLGVSSGR